MCTHCNMSVIHHLHITDIYCDFSDRGVFGYDVARYVSVESDHFQKSAFVLYPNPNLDQPASLVIDLDGIIKHVKTTYPDLRHTCYTPSQSYKEDLSFIDFTFEI